MRSIKVITYFLLLLVGVFILLIGRCLYLQAVRGEHYREVSVRQQRSLVPASARRGSILDRCGRVLAASNRVQTIKVEPRMVRDAKETAIELSRVVDLPAHEVCRMITESGNPGYAKIAAAENIEQARAARRIAAVGVDTYWRRSWPMGPLLSHVVGFTTLGTASEGLAGVEYLYDDQLRGSASESVYLADIRRRPVALGQAGAVRDGVGIILTIDATIQQFVRGELLKCFNEYQAEAAVGIVVEPATGQILAMVSLPDFDPADRTGAKEDHFRNRTITDQFEPGSIMKPIVVAIGLDEKVVNRQEKIFCENGHYRGRGFGTIGEYRRGFGDLTVKEILINSSNIGMAKIGQRLGKERLHRALELFGFGRETGIDLPGEAPGRLWPVDKWTGYSVTRIPYGQEISVTAIQMVRAFCILANGGRAVRPHVIKATVESEGDVVKVKRPVPPVGYVIDPEIARWVVTEALTAVINEGTGRRAKLEKWQVFGKTGTANIALPGGGGYSDEDYVASFIAGAPAENPQIVVLVSIRKPDKSLGKGYTGGAVASPVAGRIIEKTLTYLENTNNSSLNDRP